MTILSVLYKEVIFFETSDKIVSGKETDFQKARKLVITLQTQIKVRKNPYDYVNKLCNIFRDFENEAICEVCRLL